MIKLKRAYEAATRSDGYRVLIDRLWPRGKKKSDLPLDEWAKELAPSNELRKQFAHDPKRWREFVTRYRNELKAPELRDKIRELAAKAKRGTLTLVYSARDEEHNNAVVFRDLISRSSRGIGKSVRERGRKRAEV